ncbi:MAG: AAA family ATPase [Inquilinus sp.]|uniref:AAA family ATPase n=1 Tax=Inquilinus sp. TaxID=1932117 RepID=UPI003F33877C
MFLNSLNATQLRNFSDWVERMFGYGVDIKRTEGHISIDLIQSGKYTNIVDTGYGVSQILPVLGQIWWTQRDPARRMGSRSRLSDSPIVAIEQPELHLHPAHQAMLADLFADGIRSRSGLKAVRFLVETHSETLINKLGQLIFDKHISNDDVQIVIFNAQDLTEAPSIAISRFDEEGQLVNWPYGFFTPSEL